MSSSGPGPLLPSDIGKGGGVSFWARRLPGEIKRDLGFVRGPAPGRVVAAQPGTTSAGIASFNGRWNGQAYGCIALSTHPRISTTCVYKRYQGPLYST